MLSVDKRGVVTVILLSEGPRGVSAHRAGVPGARVRRVEADSTVVELNTLVKGGWLELIGSAAHWHSRSPDSLVVGAAVRVQLVYCP